MTKHRLKTSPFWAIAVVAALGMGLSACGGGSDGLSAAQQEAVDEAARIKAANEAAETAYEMAKMAIAAAETSEAAMEALDDVKDKITGTQTDELQTMVDERIEVIEKAERAATQRTALMEAADMVDTSDLMTQEAVAAARAAIAGLRQAIADAVDVDDTSMYQTQLDTAVSAVDTADGDITTAMNRMNQMGDLSDASTALQAALAAFAGSTPTQAQLDAANTALGELNDAIMAGMDLTDAEKAPYQREANNAAAPITAAQTAFDDAEDEADKAANAAMAATAAKLYAGISAPMGDANNPAANRFAQYNDAATAIMVHIGDGTTADTTGTILTEDKKTTVAANHGWEGKRYADAAGGDMVEAVVYSNVGDPTEGDPFNKEYTDDKFNAATGVLDTATTEGTAGNVASPRFDHSAGVKEFKKGDNDIAVMISGSYHGVPGTYSCTPGTDNTCAVRVAVDGFDLGGTVDANNSFDADNAEWTFKPSDANARVTESADIMYASYGWWIRKAADDGSFTASAFVDDRGDLTVNGLNALNGKATYMGGAAGKYALSSSTGGTNDAGHFTARATLEANFTTHTAANAITGTIDQLMGADGMPRAWSVKLNGSPIGNAGEISNLTNGTEWTIDETAAADSGNWAGSLRDEGDDGVPQVATGTFYTEYGLAGKMVGAFGANVQ